MRITDIPFGTTNWSSIEPTVYKGDVGTATWRTRSFGPPDNPIRVRLVEYSAGYEADHWCEKGHILLCLEGELETRLKDGRVFKMKAGESYQVADGSDAHRSQAPKGAKLFIVD
jgi:quercetin dioxygenase-like cupin family protein